MPSMQGKVCKKIEQIPRGLGSESLGELLIEASTVEDINYAGAKKR